MKNGNPRDAVRGILETMVSLARRRIEVGPPMTDTELMRIRTELRDQLIRARKRLGKIWTERDSYLLLFPLVVHLDEIVQMLVPEGRGGGWTLLQKELFDTEKGGQLFYEALDELLETEQANPFVYEVYAFCLSLGFRGKYLGLEAEVDGYKESLSERLATPAELQPEINAGPEVATTVRSVRSQLWYYAFAILLIIAGYVGLGELAEQQAPDFAVPSGISAGPS